MQGKLEQTAKIGVVDNQGINGSYHKFFGICKKVAQKF